MKKSLVFWFTGLSGSGKTTIAQAVKSLLESSGYSVMILDGDDVRKSLHGHLGFAEEDIKKNNALIIDLCRTHRQDYDVIFVPIISPYEISRKDARQKLGEGFYEIHCSADLETVMQRDVKGLYRKAINNEIKNMIGFSPGNIYESPQSPDFVINTGKESVSKSVESFFQFVNSRLENNENL